VRRHFQIGRHLLHVFGEKGRWVVAVDGVLLHPWFESPADAWTAGVVEADRLDRLAPDAPPGTVGDDRLQAR
jgi:hypothetical protein